MDLLLASRRFYLQDLLNKGKGSPGSGRDGRFLETTVACMQTEVDFGLMGTV